MPAGAGPGVNSTALTAAPSTISEGFGLQNTHSAPPVSVSMRPTLYQIRFCQSFALTQSGSWGMTPRVVVSPQFWGYGRFGKRPRFTPTSAMPPEYAHESAHGKHWQSETSR